MENNITIQDVQNYIEGNANYLLDKIGLLPEEVKTKVEERKEICNQCSFAIWQDSKIKKCSICSCLLPNKCYALDATCPKQYWKEIIK